VSASGGGIGEQTEAQANERFAVSYVTGTHNFKTGIFQQGTGSESLWELNQSITHRYRNGIPNSLIQWDFSPGDERSVACGRHLRAGSVDHAQNDAQPGLAVRHLLAWVPDTDIPAGRFGAARHYDQDRPSPQLQRHQSRIGAHTICW